MDEQAARLRELIASKKPAPSLTARTIAITSGKGGVGKTSVAANLGVALTKFHKKVVLIDVDLGLANIDVLLGIRPTFNLQHVVEGRKQVSDIIVRNVYGIDIIPASSGVEELADLSEYQKERLLDGFEALEDDYDIVLIDTAAGISPNVLSFVLAANEVLAVTTPEPTAFTDVYAMIKVINRHRPKAPIHLVVNMARTEQDALKTIKNIRTVSQQFLNLDVRDFGFIPYDETVVRAIRTREPFAVAPGGGPAADAIRSLAARVSNNNVSSGKERGLAGFVRRAMLVREKAAHFDLAQ